MDPKNVPYEPPLPPLRVPARSSDGKSVTLAFRDRASQEQAWGACERTLLSRCKKGALAGCSISALKRCAPPWYTKFLFWKQEDNSLKAAEEREACEIRATEKCMAEAQRPCEEYAAETCAVAFDGEYLA
eukprot:jgi/Mesvir1/11715/Mv00099-RA.1